jgi:hypothetical protein
MSAFSSSDSNGNHYEDEQYNLMEVDPGFEDKDASTHRIDGKSAHDSADGDTDLNGETPQGEEVCSQQSSGTTC